MLLASVASCMTRVNALTGFLNYFFLIVPL